MNNNENISISKLLAVLDIQDDDSLVLRQEKGLIK